MRLKYMHLSLFLILSLSIHGVANTNNNAKDKVKSLILQYQNIPSVHFIAEQKTFFNGPTDADKRTHENKYEYWGNAEKYRSTFSSSDTMDGEKLIDVDVAYNGEKFQRFDASSLIMNYRQEDINITPSFPHNPMIYPVIFCRPFLLSPEDKGSHLRLKDINNDTLLKSVLENCIAIDEDTAKIQTKFGNQTYIYYLYFDGGSGSLPRKIELFADNQKMLSIDFNEFFTDPKDEKINWPKSNKYTVHLKDGEIILDSNLSVFELEAKIHDGVFDLDHTKAKYIWDDDLELAVKRTMDRVPFPSLLEDTSDQQNISHEQINIAKAKNLEVNKPSEISKILVENKEISKPEDKNKSQNPNSFGGQKLLIMLLLALAIIIFVFVFWKKQRIK